MSLSFPRSHQEAKLEALQNAVVRTALPGLADENKPQLFLRLIDSYTPLHLQILNFLNDPLRAYAAAGKSFPNPYASGLFTPLIDLYPEPASQRPLVDLCVRNLHMDGMIGVDTLHAMMTEAGLKSPHTTPLGKEFVNFVAEP